jgi:GDP-D-mannose 3',5'-epimerase
MISINNLVKLVSSIDNKSISIKHIDGPLGVRGRNSENSMIREKLNWDYEFKLKDGIAITYKWVVEQIEN